MKILKYLMSLALVFSLLAACSTLPRGFEFTPDQVLVHQASGTTFPEQIVSFSRSLPVSYNPEGTDISVNYQSKEPLASNLDMYVFPASNVSGPTELTNQHSDFVRTIIKSHPGVLVESDADVQVTQSGKLLPAKQATFSYSGVFHGIRQELFSLLIEFEFNGWFVSYRMDTPAGGKGEALDLLLEFICLAPLPSKAYTIQTKDFFGLVKIGTPQSVQEAIDKGADVSKRDKDGATAMMYAAVFNRNPEVITKLLQAGADLKARNKTGLTPLICAAGYNSNPEVITILLQAGADLEAQAKNAATALIAAAWRNENLEVITTLLKAGADVKARDNKGHTALMWAALYSQNPEVIMALLKARADAKAKDAEGKTAFDYARKNEKLKSTEAYRQLQIASQ